ncbi:hypothetical protein [Rubrolithibacter danxiaensis]|uniref:hypothetical protein n=1 Tax=Rubrolithibacter danxiaensis TaxID=3390805 RepID=UPI003BF8F5B2
MKKITSLAFKALTVGVALTMTVVFSCKKNEDSEKKVKSLASMKSLCDGKQISAANFKNTLTVSAESTLPYTVSLISRTSNNDGTYTWIWSVTNPNPGNGKNNGTVQDLSHWGISLGACATLNDVVSAATSTDGENWSAFTPSYNQDKSQDCYSDPILKFDVGTTGSQTTYYRLIVSKNFTIEKRTALYKSGANTGCGVFEICAIGCLAN